jgi:hypothetical protein
MKVFATGLDSNNNIDGYFPWHIFCTGAIEVTKTIKDADCIFICLGLKTTFVFDELTYNSILESSLKIVIFDYTEYGEGSYLDDEYEKFLYGDRIFGWSHAANLGKLRTFPEYKKIITKLEEIPHERIACYFMREMSTRFDYDKCPFPVYPCDYALNNIEVPPLESFEEFKSRRVLLTFNSGSGVSARRRMYGELYVYAAEKDFLVASTEAQVKTYSNYHRRFLTLLNREGGADERIDFRPYYKMSKLIMDMAGSGIKCVRNLESAAYAASTKQISRLQFAFPWIHKKNCIEVKTRETNNRVFYKSVIRTIDSYLSNPQELYSIYVKGRENAIKYTSKYYVDKYIVPTIEGNL